MNVRAPVRAPVSVDLTSEDYVCAVVALERYARATQRGEGATRPGALRDIEHALNTLRDARYGEATS